MTEFLGTSPAMKYHDCLNRDCFFCLALSYQEVSSIFQGYYDDKGVSGNLSYYYSWALLVQLAVVVHLHILEFCTFLILF